MYNLDDTMATELVVKKWGNSLAIIIPSDLVEKKNIKENDKVAVEIFKPADFTKIFGSLKSKMTGQEFKDFVREGWK